MKLLITILTSADIELLEICYASVMRQIVPREILSQITYHPVIIVNSLNANYAASVRARFPQVTVIDSVSNGKPGKGHNAEVDYFRKHEEYDWHLPVDGDDVLYPTAVWQLASLLLMTPVTKPAFDVLLFLGLDRVCWKAGAGSVVVSENVYLTTAFEEVNHLLSPDAVLRNPFAAGANIYNMACPTRIALMNRAAVDAQSPALVWDESVPMLEDFAPLLAAYSHHLRGSLRLAGTSNRYIYLYNQLNTNNATARFSARVAPDAKDDKANAAFMSMIAPYNGGTDVMTRYEELRRVPFVKAPENHLFIKTMRNKIGFVQNTLVKEYMRRHKVVVEAMQRRQKK